MKILIHILFVLGIIAVNTSAGFADEIQTITTKRYGNTVPVMVAKESSEELKNLGLTQKWMQELDGEGFNRVVPQHKNVYVVVPYSSTSCCYSVYCLSLNGVNRWRTYMNSDTSTFITSVREGINDVTLSGFIEYNPIVPGISNLYSRTVDAEGNVTSITNFRDVNKCVFVANGNLDWAFRLKDDNLMTFVPVSKTKYYLPTFAKVSFSKQVVAYKEYPQIGNDSIGPVKIARVIESPSGDVYILGLMYGFPSVKGCFIYKLNSSGELLDRAEWDESRSGLGRYDMTLLSNGTIAVVTSAVEKAELYYPTSTVSLFTSDLKPIRSFPITGKKYFQGYAIAEMNNSTLIVTGTTAPEYTAKAWEAVDPIWDYAAVTMDMEGQNQKLASWGDATSTTPERITNVARGADGTIYMGWQNGSKYMFQALAETVSSVEEQSDAISCAPNPSDGGYTVRASVGNAIRVYNALGVMIESGVCESDAWHSAPSLYGVGQYIVETEDAFGKKTHQKIVVLK